MKCITYSLCLDVQKGEITLLDSKGAYRMTVLNFPCTAQPLKWLLPAEVLYGETIIHGQGNLGATCLTEEAQACGF